MIDWKRHPILTAERPPRRIAVLRALHLGDLLLAVPALRALRSGFRGAEITLIGLPWAASFAERFQSYIDRFEVFPGYPGIVEAAVDAQRTERFLREQRARDYDLVIQMHGNGRISNQFVLALAGEIAVGYYESAPPPGLTLGAPYPDRVSEIQRNLGLTRLLGCPNRSTKLEFPLFDGDRAEAAALLAGIAKPSRPLIAIHAGARSPARRWSAQSFAAVADHFAERVGAQVLLTGGPDEVATAQEVADAMAHPPLNLTGQTSLGALGAIIDTVDLFISNDTGPAHIADALGTPSVTIFGPADPRRWAPLDRSRHPIVRWPVECSPCGHWQCPIDHPCLHLLTPDVVIQVASQLITEGAVA